MSLPEAVASLIRSARVIAVVGISNNPARPSHGVAQYLQRQGYRIIPVNPTETAVLGSACYPSLEAIPPELGAVDIVDVFRRSEHVPDVAASARRIGARLLWLQEGVSHAAAEAEARVAGLLVVSDRCLLKEHVRLMRGRE